MRTAYVGRNDSLPRIALRELGDARLWTTIAELNALVAPYVSDDAIELRALGIICLAPGEPILIPDGNGSVARTAVQAELEVYGQDHAWDAVTRTLKKQAWDTAQNIGIDNLRAALERRISTRLGDLVLHPNYGNAAWQHLGKPADSWRLTLAAEDTRVALSADPRVQSIEEVTALWTPDAALHITAHIIPKPPNERLVVTAIVS